MKTPFITQTAFLLVLLGLASCRTAKTSAPPPGKDKSIIIVSNPSPSTKLPPGQAKKIYGDQSAKSHAPGQQKKQVGRVYFPLIIIRTPDIVISRNHDGRYYYKNAHGYYYWQGTDSRFYLGEEYLDKIKYDEKEFEDWNLKRKKDNGKDDQAKDEKEHEEKAGKGNGKGNGQGNEKNNGNKKN